MQSSSSFNRSHCIHKACGFGSAGSSEDQNASMDWLGCAILSQVCAEGKGERREASINELRIVKHAVRRACDSQRKDDEWLLAHLFRFRFHHFLPHPILCSYLLSSVFCLLPFSVPRNTSLFLIALMSVNGWGLTSSVLLPLFSFIRTVMVVPSLLVMVWPLYPFSTFPLPIPFLLFLSFVTTCHVFLLSFSSAVLCPLLNCSLFVAPSLSFLVLLLPFVLFLHLYFFVLFIQCFCCFSVPFCAVMFCRLLTACVSVWV